MTFPTSGSSIYYNDDGEVTGWSDESSYEPEYDPGLDIDDGPYEAPEPEAVCVDCVQVIANGVETSEQAAAAERMATIWSAIGYLVLRFDDPDNDFELGFSHYACDGCGSSLGGDRFAADVVYR